VVTTIGDVLEQTVLRYPTKEALYDARTENRWSYQEWDREINRLAHAFLHTGVQKGDRVSTFLYNTAELATVFFASAKIGSVFNPINFRLKAEEVRYIIEDAEPKILLFEQALEPEIARIQNDFPAVHFCCIDGNAPEYADSYEQMVSGAAGSRVGADVSEDDLYAIMYTSGTTGRPKGVMHTHRDIVEQSTVIITGQRLTHNDRGLAAAPLFHCAELHCAFLPRVHIGASNIIIPGFDPKQALDLIENEKITVTFMAPTMWNMLLQEDLSGYDLNSLRIGLYGAAPMAPSLVRKVRDQLGIGLVQAYGMTEMGPAITFLFEDEQISKAGSAGKAILNHEIRVVQTHEERRTEPEQVSKTGEVGEIIVKGPSMMSGYYKRKDATDQAMHKGWYYSGDLGYMDDEGYLWVADRVDDMVISGGENIYPREIEDALYEHPGILDVAVLGEPDEKWGEKVIAYVVKKDELLTAKKLDAFCKESNSLASYKRPRTYTFVETLPRNASGKIQKFVLREGLQKGETTSF
jgi:long-chain acyl-CoA synthetase